MDHSFIFKSTELGVIPGEDEETNPLRYGKSIANWISDGFNAVGFSTVVNPEDWGWRIDCVSEPYPVWIGCGNMEEDDGQGNFKEPDINNLTWQCFVSADKPFFKSLFKKLDATEQINQVAIALKKLIENTDHITQVREQ
jgi:hypothetical protein